MAENAECPFSGRRGRFVAAEGVHWYLFLPLLIGANHHDSTPGIIHDFEISPDQTRAVIHDFQSHATTLAAGATIIAVVRGQSVAVIFAQGSQRHGCVIAKTGLRVTLLLIF